MSRPLQVIAAFCAAALLSLPHHAASDATLTRGPYIQNASSDAVTVVWHTSSATTPELRVSRFPGPPWEIIRRGDSDTEHEFILSGLLPDTEYFYEVTDGDAVLASGPTFRFHTHPADNSPRPFRFMAFGDCGTGDSYQWDLAALINGVVPRADFALVLGDIVYEVGAWEDFDPNFFEPYNLSLRNQVFWPVLGNHDIGTQNGAPYVANYVLPTDSGAPSHPSGTERYYSFDYGTAHFVGLDFWSSGVSKDAGGDQYNWFVDDLEHAQARDKRWIVVFGHSPPYTKGSHDSDLENDLANVAQTWVPVMESHGVDLYLAGHSHVYERSFLAQNDAILQNDPDTYTKIGTDAGTIYIVGGAGGKKGGGSLDHPLMAEAVGGVNGFVVIDITNDELRGSYEREDGLATDLFTIHKELDVAPPSIEEAFVTSISNNEVRVVFDEPVKPGSSTGGSEDPANYSIDGGVSVLAADLASDGRSVTLDVSALSPFAAYTLTVNAVRDRASPPNTVAANSRALLVGRDSSPPGIAEGATWRYHEGSSSPGATWMDPGFNDSSWPTGQAGFGFGDGDDATNLNDMLGNYPSVYVRRAFDVNDASAVHTLHLHMSYDDGFVAFLNGSEVARVNVPNGQNHNTEANAGHEAFGFQTFDLSGCLGDLVDGENVLAIQGHNEGVWNSDFSLHPALDVLGDVATGNAAPVAVLQADRTTATAPATVRMSADRSTDDGSIVSYFWDFGDGASTSGEANVEHEYSEPGVYVATLLLEDDGGASAVATRTIFLHDVGENPVGTLESDTIEIEAGEAIQFTATGISDPDGGSVEHLWDFGDPASGPANISLASAPNHRFGTGGNFDVSLTLTDDEGSQTTLWLNVGVGVPAVVDEDEGTVDPGSEDNDGEGDDTGGGGGDPPASSGGSSCFGPIQPGAGGPPPWQNSFVLTMAGLFALLWTRRRRAPARTDSAY